MQFDNQKTTIRIYLHKMFMAIFFAVLVIIILGLHFFDKPMWGFERYHLILIIAGIYLLIIAFVYFRELNYFYFRDEGDKIIIRFYPIRPIGRKKKAIEVPKINFAGFEIKKSFLGLKTYLILHQHVKKSTVKYPPISITSLTRTELELLEKQLSRYIRK